MILFWLLGAPAFAQDYSPMLQPDSLRQAKYFHLSAAELLDQIEIESHLKVKIDSLQNQGYFAASIDSTSVKDSVFYIHAYLGKQYQIKSINAGNVAPEVYNVHFSSNEPLSWAAVTQKKQDIVKHYVNQGYLNAQLQLDKISFFGDDISADLDLSQGQQFVLDSIAINGDLEIRQSFLLSTLEVEKGQVINQSFFEKINKQVPLSRFMEMKGAPSFQLKEDGKAIVYLPLNEKAANEFDLLIGFQPNPNPRLSNNKLLLTGEGRLQLYNPFGAGREFFVDYKQLRPESPRLQANLFFPQFLNTDFGVVGSFDLFKQDSSFVNVNGSFGVRYDFKDNRNLAVTYRRSRSFLQDVDTNFVKQMRQLPASVDFTQNVYQADFTWQKTNQLRNPSRGFVLKLAGGVGNRAIVKNDAITNLQADNFDFASLYNGLNDDKLLLSTDFKGQLFLPAFKRSTFLVQNQTGMKDVNRFFENDLYRLGGYSSIRGFDEQSYLASVYSISTAEYRLLLNQESYFSVFGDWGYLKNQATDQTNHLLGLGTGLDLATQAGIFSLNLAVGQDDNTGFDFNKTRLHIGYVNVF